MDKILLGDSEIDCIFRSKIGFPVQKMYSKLPPGTPVVFIGVLNGSFMVMTSLMKWVSCKCEVDFIKVKSYENNQQMQSLKIISDIACSIKDKAVFLVEDIVDSGNTIKALKRKLKRRNPYSITVVSLLYKKSSEKFVDVGGYMIDEDMFVYGYGMDNNNTERNRTAIYYFRKGENTNLEE